VAGARGADVHSLGHWMPDADEIMVAVEVIVVVSSA